MEENSVPFKIDSFSLSQNSHYMGLHLATIFLNLYQNFKKAAPRGLLFNLLELNFFNRMVELVEIFQICIPVKVNYNLRAIDSLPSQ